MIHFTANRLQVLDSLKRLKVAFGKDYTKTAITSCEITVTNTKATFSVPGAYFSAPCEANGAAKAVVPFLVFFKLIQTESLETIEMKIEPSRVWLGNLSFSAETWFFPNDRILRTIQLPMYYTLIDLVQLTKQNYTKEELEFNKIPQRIQEASVNLEKSIKSCYNKLKVYGFRFEEVESFVKSKIFN
jgi:hypothetical protein